MLLIVIDTFITILKNHMNTCIVVAVRIQADLLFTQKVNVHCTGTFIITPLN